jgi:hypothetical protein
MFIKVEPADFFMYRVILIFDLEKPDSEDLDVRGYLAEQELEPRYQSMGELDERQCEFLQFGGCYLGKHLDSISQIQRRAVEIELLTAEIEGHLNAPGGPASQISPEERPTAIAELASGFQQESSFKTDDNGDLIAVLDGDAVREAARRLTAGSSHF